MPKLTVIVSAILMMSSFAAFSEDANCPTSMLLSDINFIENDVKVVVVSPITIEKFESVRNWEHVVGDVTVHATLNMQNSSNRKRALLAKREIYAISEGHSEYDSEFESILEFDDPTVSGITISHSAKAGTVPPPVSVGSFEKSLDNAVEIRCPKADVIPSLRQSHPSH